MLRKDAEKIYLGAIASCLPDSAVREAMRSFELPKGRLILVAIGKAAWKMARCAADVVTDMGGRIDRGAVITKYGHSEGELDGIDIYEAAHPVPDAAGMLATERVLEMTENLRACDTVLFLVSGGGSTLFESPYCTLEELARLTSDLLRSGADIGEVNAVRKHVSRVKGGRFAEHVYPAKVFGIVLSDVVGNRLDTIASGPTTADVTTSDEAAEIISRYNISISDSVRLALMRETPKRIDNAVHFIGGSVAELCTSAKKICQELGYKAEIITDKESGIAREVGARLARLAVEKCDTDTPIALITGGETVVKLKGNGLGGRNQEAALAAAGIISGHSNIAFFSVGSDGTDGPTDAAGGFVCGNSYSDMLRAGVQPLSALENNDSYNALAAIGGLIMTGPTGTNVNDLAVALVRVKSHGEGVTERRFSNLERVLLECRDRVHKNKI